MDGGIKLCNFQFLDRAQETLAGGNKKHYNEASDTGKEP